MSDTWLRLSETIRKKQYRINPRDNKVSDDKLDSFPGVWYQQVGGNTMSTLQVFGSSVWMAKCDHGQNAQRGVAGKNG